MYRPALTLTINNARTALEAGLKAIGDGQTEFDLGDLTVVDSAAVATLLAWQRAAAAGGKSLVFRNLPASLQSLATLYGVTGLLHLAPAGESRAASSHH
ncbi:MAG TPA: STAS domain-containing protein [Noviherbaspirillum sp.]|uniref:STAS domain-containing protein n=1 Tax=Noviherbaspirillum sp. TaxID=1926288 RepID=UPI002B4696A9|nr:STAS domain-containing protein [Noviherbaspirillum sp.]HJV87861.1 STAS domain-containing protein [Noviherbaspirillum sp.]